jgi:ribA/ribD-fused uncharacterized protein
MNVQNIRSQEMLVQAIKAGFKPKYLFFWGHQSSSDVRPTKTCLSQWFYAPFKVEDIIYPTAEHFMMEKKATLFGDEITAQKIREAQDPGKAKALGRAVKNFDNRLWDQRRWAIVVEANMHKFNQNLQLKSFLIETSSRVLVEASPVDRIWGIGLDAASSQAENPSEWLGLNLLGFALMEVRALLAKTNVAKIT